MKIFFLKLTALLAGVLIAVLLLETFLFFLGGVYKIKLYLADKLEQKKYDGSEYIILCLGDSNTLGMGIPPQESYPAQLEKMLRLKFLERNVRVINHGIPSYNTAQILNALPADIENFKPDLIILLAGGANAWNFYGYKNEHGQGNLRGSFLNALKNTRTYKFIKYVRSAF